MLKFFKFAGPYEFHPRICRYLTEGILELLAIIFER